MDNANFNQAPSAAHPETMDFLSRTWCNFAVQSLQLPDQLQGQQQVILLENSIQKFDNNCSNANFMKIDKSMKMDNSDHVKSIPPWKSNDVKSWIWMQQAMHPELNYNRYSKRAWFQWKIEPFKNVSIKKWLKDIRQRRKEEERLQRAEVHAVISVAGVAAALAAIAAENAKDPESTTGKETAVASAAALVAAHCAHVAEAMGAKREQLSRVIGSAMSGTNATDVLTLTAAAATSLKGAATLKARSGYKSNRLDGGAPVLPIEDNHELDFNLEKFRSGLAKGLSITIETPDGKCKVRWVSIVQNSEAKVILKIKKLNLLRSKKECVVLDMHIELYKDTEEKQEGYGTCYLIVLTTCRGTFKLDMEDDYPNYKTWTSTINHMLMLSSSLTKYKSPFYSN